MKKISNILLILVGVFLFIAAAFLFRCPKMGDGTAMNCHKANAAVALLAGIIVVLGILLFWSRNRMLSLLFSAAIGLAAVVSAIVPGRFLALCMMPEMTCRAVFRPVDIICSTLILIFAVFQLFAVRKEENLQ